jgi:hypothetical protein
VGTAVADRGMADLLSVQIVQLILYFNIGLIAIV